MSERITHTSEQLDNAINAEQAIASTRLADIESKPVQWLWPGRIAKGKATLIAGDPGLGKSQITASLAAITTVGGHWPLEWEPAEIGNVLMLSAEDDPADTIRPRMEAAGADLSRIHIVEGVADGDFERPVSLSRDLSQLGDKIQTIGNVALAVIDPISAFLGDADSHKNADVRALLASLGQLAAEHKTAVVCVSHLNKDAGGSALSRVMGSLAFVAAARAAYIVTQDPKDETRRLFLPAKNNIAPDDSGLAFHIESSTVGGIETSRIFWHNERVSISPDEALSLHADEDRTETDEAVDFLQDLLAEGPVNAAEAKKQAGTAGIGDKALRRARERLGVKPKKRDFSGGWVWESPSKMPNGAEGDQYARRGNMGNFEAEGHLREDSADQDEVF